MSRSTMTTTTDKTVINTVAHNICAEVTGGEIESPRCNSGETSNTHTTIVNSEFNYGGTNNEQTPHSSARKTVCMIDCSINHDPSLTTVNTCEVKYSSNDSIASDSTVYSPITMISNDDDTSNKDIRAIDPAKVNIANTKLADDDPVQRTEIFEIDCDGTLVDPLDAPSVHKETSGILGHIIDGLTRWTYEDVIGSTKVELATNKIADDDPPQLTLKLENNEWTYGDVIGSTKVELATNKIADDNPPQSTLKLENNDPVCIVAVSANPVKVNVVTHVLADDNPVTLSSDLANIDPVKANIKINKLADNDPVHQTGTLKKTQINALDGKVIFQLPKSTTSVMTNIWFV
jgi:hypothetical protein